MPDTTAIADEIRRLITTGAAQTELIAVVAHLASLFPDMTLADLSAAMQEAMAEAERQATRRALRIIPSSETEGILRLQSSGRWAIFRPGREPVELISGELFRIDVDGELRVTRMGSFAPPRNLLRLSDNFPDASVLLSECARLGLEGIVAKRKYSAYRSGLRSGLDKSENVGVEGRKRVPRKALRKGTQTVETQWLQIPPADTLLTLKLP